jgi:hypothetical protein
MKKVKYKITAPFANLPINAVIDAYVILGDESDNGKAVIFHPPCTNDINDCGSMEICVLSKDDLYVSINNDAYINLSQMQCKNLEAMLEVISDISVQRAAKEKLAKAKTHKSKDSRRTSR